MMKLLLAILFSIITINVYSQRYFEIGAFGGISYYNGDLNPSQHLKPSNNHLAVGLIARQVLNSRWALRGSFNIGNLSGSDAESNDPFQQQRNLSFYTRIYELSAGIEFNFRKFNPFNPPSAFRQADMFTPFVFIGIGGFYFNPKTELDGNEYELQPLKTEGEEYSRIGVSIPFGVGCKLRVSQRTLVSFEYGLRQTFTDYIDDVSSVYPENPNELNQTTRKLSDRSVMQQGSDGSNWGTQRGNSKTTDWYSFVGVTLTFNLTVNPHRCHFNQDKL